MKLPWLFHPDVEEDVDEARSWYEADKAGLGSAFVEVVRTGIADVQAAPGIAAPSVVDGERVRRLVLEDFPYTIVFAERKHAYFVLAISHQSRSDEHWRKRMRRASKR